MKITQALIAKDNGISDAHLSNILAGKDELGKATAKKFGEFTGIPWTDFLTMAPEEIRTALFEAAEKRVESAA